MYACKENVAPVIDTSMSISVISKLNSSDLLNPTNPKKFDISEVRVSYPPNPQKYSIESNTQNGQAHLYYGSDGKYYIKFYPAANYTQQADNPTIVINWPDKTEDRIEPYIVTDKGHIYVSEIYLNNILSWNFDSEKNNTTNRPTRSINVTK